MNRSERRARERQQKNEISALHRRANRIASAQDTVAASQRLFQLGKGKEALPNLLRAAGVFPDNPDVRGALAYALAATGQIGQAIEHYRALLWMQPDAVPVITNLALLLAKAGNRDEALQLLERAAALAPQHANTAFALAEMLAWHRRQADAFRQYQQAITLFRHKIGPEPGIEHCDDLVKLATAQIWTGDIVAGLRSLDKAVELRPEHALALVRRGQALIKLRRFPEAIASLTRAAAAEPDIAAVRRALGDAYGSTGDAEAAQEQYLAATRIDPRDELAEYFLAAVRHENPDAPPPAYVVNLFDQYAQTFEHHLVDVLQYRAPNLVCAAVLEVAGSEAADWNVIDLGCGTGLCGPLIRHVASHIVGVDLSSAMLDKAREKSVYDELRRGDAAEVLGTYEDAFDIALCADVMVYLGSLTPIFAAAARALKPGALFAFTTEVHYGDGFVLDTTRRYLHSRRYVENEVVTHGFVVVHFETIVARYQEGEPVPETVFVVRRAPADG